MIICEVRPLFAPPPHAFQRTVYRPGEIVQFDVWQPRKEVPVGHGQTHRGWVVIACLGYSRAGAGVLVFSTQTEDLLGGIAGCLERLGGLPRTLVSDRQAGIHGHGGRQSEAFAAFCGQLKVGWRFCQPADPQAKGAVERLQGKAETNFEPGRVFAIELDFQDQLDAWCTNVNARTHQTLKIRPVDRLNEELRVIAALREQMPDTARRCHPVPPDPHVRFDSNDYSLDPALVGSRIEVRVDQRAVTAVALDTRELACRQRSRRNASFAAGLQRERSSRVWVSDLLHPRSSFGGKLRSDWGSAGGCALARRRATLVTPWSQRLRVRVLGPQFIRRHAAAMRQPTRGLCRRRLGGRISTS
jgi:hypothetical protein